MDEPKLSDDVFDQIKDFNRYDLTEEQELLIDKLILNEELKKWYKNYGLCKECKRIKSGYKWCGFCIFQSNFKNWTSGNQVIDEFIQKTQLKAIWYNELIEWIEYDRFENVKYLAKGGFGSVYKADWKDGFIRSIEKNQLNRHGKTQVALKCLHNSQDITTEFLNEVGGFFQLYQSYKC